MSVDMGSQNKFSTNTTMKNSNDTKSSSMSCVFCENFDKKLGGGTREFFALCPALSTAGQVLDVSENFVLIPDIAPLTNDHLLLVSRFHYNSFASIPRSIVHEAESIIERILIRMKEYHPTSELFAFEHGAGRIGDQMIQCGTCNSTDHAHLHLLPLPASKLDNGGIASLLVDELKTLGLRQETISPLPDLSLENIVRGKPYLFLWSNRESKSHVLIQETIGCIIPSQILRRMLAIRALGLQENQSELWDWRNLYMLFPRQVSDSITTTVQRWLLNR